MPAAPHRSRQAGICAAACAVLVLLVSGCARVVPGRASAAAPPATAAVGAPGADAAGTPADSDEVAAAAAAALQELWRTEFRVAFGREWRDVESFVAVRPGSPRAPAPPCVESAADLAGQAFYCPSADAVVWDAEGLLPDLQDRFGPVGILVVLAHEVGHAVQSRLGVDEAQAREPARYPTILLESMADCYAGVALARMAGATGPGSGPRDRDEALLALVGFRDPLGVEPGDVSAHGNAFDRVSAFQDGWRGGAQRCAEMTLDNRTFTQRRFGSAADRARGGNLPMAQLLVGVEADARDWFGGVAAPRAPGWSAPPLRASRACTGVELARQGPARFCAADGAVSVDRDGLARLHERFGDYAGATLVATRYGLAVLRATGAGTSGPGAGQAAVCLAGAWTGRLLGAPGPFALSPGDLDEAVQVLLTDDWAARDAAGTGDPGGHGFDRVDRFRTGLFDGPAGCLPPA